VKVSLSRVQWNLDCLACPQKANGLAIHLWAENAHEIETAVGLGIVEPIADHKLVGDLESNIVHM
jgi:hypothetical protein